MNAGSSGDFGNAFPAVLSAGLFAVILDDGKKFQQKYQQRGVRHYSRILTPV
jgi:hypothetical protein